MVTMRLNEKTTPTWESRHYKYTAEILEQHLKASHVFYRYSLLAHVRQFDSTKALWQISGSPIHIP